MRVSFYCQAEEYHNVKLHAFLSSTSMPWVYRDVIRIISEDASRVAFFFNYGVCVFWGYTKEEEVKFIEQLRPFCHKPLDTIPSEELSYFYGNHLSFSNDEITLTSADPLAKLAVSHAMAQSIKLETFENRIQNTVTETRDLPEEIAQKGKIHLSRKNLSILMGKVFRDKSLLNLHFDLLDTPEFIWEYTEYEPLYLTTSSYYDIAKRVELLNNKIGVLHELLDLLEKELQYKHFVKLEWIIIILILIEIIIMTFHEFFQ